MSSPNPIPTPIMHESIATKEIPSIRSTPINQTVCYDCYDYRSVCATCRKPFDDNCSIYMFCDHKYCSEVCREDAIEYMNSRRYY